jgi:hypothetical protein
MSVAEAAAPPIAPFDYAVWTTLLAAIVTPEGKVDYEILMDHRAELAAFVTQLGAASPDTAPERFPTPEHALAYWINAYNAFVPAWTAPGATTRIPCWRRRVACPWSCSAVPRAGDPGSFGATTG